MNFSFSDSLLVGQIKGIFDDFDPGFVSTEADGHHIKPCLDPVTVIGLQIRQGYLRELPSLFGIHRLFGVSNGKAMNQKRI